ncbi:hypothetical protein TNIN_320061 [Trichonephila inaurata madagascariensis]|uniref:Uncharacterized protein n=1 Tax=Trichonephila inaurata madagascariensis TaxID=2747483 RepID=A0A8X6X4J9_9ARAC|nr:hypothetical protein TNIN_320061 [Trichonephila inaurata madagascariensis]
MDKDRRWTLLELDRISGIEKRTVHRTLRNEPHLRKTCSMVSTACVDGSFKGGCTMQYTPTILLAGNKMAINSCHERSPSMNFCSGHTKQN